MPIVFLGLYAHEGLSPRQVKVVAELRFMSLVRNIVIPYDSDIGESFLTLPNKVELPRPEVKIQIEVGNDPRRYVRDEIFTTGNGTVKYVSLASLRDIEVDGRQFWGQGIISYFCYCPAAICNFYPIHSRPSLYNVNIHPRPFDPNRGICTVLCSFCGFLTGFRLSLQDAGLFLYCCNAICRSLGRSPSLPSLPANENSRDASHQDKYPLCSPISIHAG